MGALPPTLDAWLEYIGQQHPKTIDLGLHRVATVRDRLAAMSKAAIITVGGTNGKGSTCAMLEAILRAAGYRVGLYTSPHLLRYNERVRIDASEVSDELLCQAFTKIEQARGDVSLSYFEYSTLAAWQIFADARLDVIILEVGLGGRLDAVNIFEPDCAIVTGVAMDHMDYLGDTRDKIGFEKAGIYRAGKPAICGDPAPPTSLLAHAEAIGAKLWISGRDFRFAGDKNQWNYMGPTQRRNSLAYPTLRGANQLLNASSVLAALESIGERLPVPMQAVRQGLMLVELPARFQVLPGKPANVLDVAHNPQAVAVLADNLMNMGFFPNTYAVCGMLADKDIRGSLQHMLPRVDQWFLCDLPGPRAAGAVAMSDILRAMSEHVVVTTFPDPVSAWQAAAAIAGEGDRIVTFGSFLTVAAVLPVIAASR